MRTRSISNVSVQVLAITAAATLGMASPTRHHQHHHEHFEKRDSEVAHSPELSPRTPLIAYDVDGRYVDEAEVCQGLQNGTLQWPAELQVSKPKCASNAPTATSSTEAETSAQPVSEGLDKDFPDGEIECSKFPAEYGPISVEWAKIGGWSGIQYVTIQGDAVTYIETANPGDSCKPGAMCSYACPAGYQKSQWPSAQGASGESVGGLQCNENGKLALTNPGLSKKLCIKGTGQTQVQNKLSFNAAVCRTDYPGTENEIIPLNTQPDSTHPLTCPDASQYYKHQGDPTSAQYYINNQGVALEDACNWSTDGSGMGNWAPSYLGVGQDVNGKTWLSISSTAQNNPSKYQALNYTVEITGDISGTCRLSGGQYCSGTGYDDCNNAGCTVQLMSGQATYVFSD